MNVSHFRPDIEGLRGVAVLLVLAFHAGLPVSGGYVGVDVFFVISGYLISGLLLREAESTGRISLRDFYARRAKRLLPAASLVLLATAGITWLYAPVSQRAEFGLDAAAAAAYVVNWRFAQRSVDYLAEDVGRSPLLHFWSLSVEEQFYLIWPLLIVCAVVIAKRSHRSVRAAVAVALTLVAVPSLIWSVQLSQSEQAQGFFVTSTRLWELGLGAMTALATPLTARLPVRLATPLAVLGALAVALAAGLFDTGSEWPSYRAALPTAGAALLLISGELRSSAWPARFLSTRPLVAVGGLSYSLYLWHWPVLLVGQEWFELSGPVWGLVLVLGSALPAWLSHRYVENPIRRSQVLADHPRYTLSLGANLSLAVVAVGVAMPVFGTDAVTAEAARDSITLQAARGAVRARPARRGAGVLGTDPARSAEGIPQATSEAPPVPPPERAVDDLPRAYAEDCQITKGPDQELRWCQLGDPAGRKTAVIVGDSKILQYFDALDVTGQALGWKLTAATKGACPFSDAPAQMRGRPYRACDAVNQKLMKHFEGSPPDIIITSQADKKGLGEDGTTSVQAMVDGLVSRWSKLRALGTEVIVILDNPHPAKGPPIYECALQNPLDLTKCAFEKKAAIRRSAASVQRKAAARVPGVHWVDLTDYVCPAEMCAAVIGGVFVYRQGTHISNTYARSLAPVLTQKLSELF